jgi:hypothetical protein
MSVALRRAHRSRPICAGLAAVVAIVAVPATAVAHRISGVVDTPLPLVAYLAGAAVAVALSFAFLALTAPAEPASARPERSIMVPPVVRAALRVVGLVGWLWIVAQALLGGSSDADVASLFLWVYGWVGLAITSALIGPAWTWLDPFATLFDALAAVGRRLGLASDVRRADYPARLAHWPAVIGFAVFVWLELVVGILGGRQLGLVLVGYTVLTLAAMAQFGRDPWRANGETFSVWFALLGRLAPLAHHGPPDAGRLRRRGFGGGLAEGPWSTSLLVLVTLAVGAVLYDGLSQTEGFVRFVGFPGVATGTALMAGFLGLLVATLLGVARMVGAAAVTAGLVPVATGYVIAHYLTALLVDGQRILVAISDPLQQGWDLFGTAFHEPSIDWLPTSLIWAIQLGAVVGGHMVGAWAGHTVAVRSGMGARLGQLPLALAMVGLTTATLWSLGQNLDFGEPPDDTTGRIERQSATMTSLPDARAESSAVSTVRITA